MSTTTAITMPISRTRAWIMAPAYYVVAAALAVIIIASANDASRAYESVSTPASRNAPTSVPARLRAASSEATQANTLGPAPAIPKPSARCSRAASRAA